MVHSAFKKKEDGGIRWCKCPFGLVVKYNFEFIFPQLNLFKYIIIKLCKSKISNYSQFLIYLTKNKKKNIVGNFGGIEPVT